MQRACIVILGTTASGKSALGIKLAKHFGGVVISADSRQVYRGMDIGTGKVTKREMRGIPHFLLDVVSPRGQYSVARYVRDVTRVLKTIDPHTPVFLVGGSPFYIEALTKKESFSSVPPTPALRKRLEKRSVQHLEKFLRVLDPVRAHEIDPHNRRRLVRAIEIAQARMTGVNTKSVHLPKLNVLKLGITLPRTALYRAIDRRVDERIRRGMIAEVRRLHREGLSWKRLDDFGLEYRSISQYVRGQLARDDMIRQLKTAIHHFAKRQMTWFRRNHEIHWIQTEQQARNLVSDFLKRGKKHL